MIPRFALLCFSSLVAFVLATASVVAADNPDYSPPDADLKVIRLDTARTESFLAVKADTTGRLFVGGREALYVYERAAKGQYRPRHELLRFPNHTWVYDIEIRGDDLYILTVSALYVIPEGRTKREGLAARRLVWGVPLGHVHQCFHGMTWGPEGDLYFAMGDPLWYYGDFNRPDHWGHWTFFSRPGVGSGIRKGEPAETGTKRGRQGDKETRSEDGGFAAENSPCLPCSLSPCLAATAQTGQQVTQEKRDEKWVRTPYNGVGGVFRCRPDGSHFQVIARGMRNSCGLTFDRDWNLFTNDNDHEQMPVDYVPGRLNHVTPHAYFSWPRGWMLSKTPDRMDLLETMIATLGRAVPVGQSYYDDMYLPAKYRNSLLVARWCTRQITYYPLQHRGATFKCEEHELLAGRDLARPVHVTVGRGGRIFASICYMAHNEGSPVYKSDLVMITRADDSDDHPFDPYDAPAVEPARLWKELSNPSWSRRSQAHVEILRRGKSMTGEALSRLNDARTDDPARTSLVWIAAASDDSEAVEQALTKAATDSPGSMRLQAVRALDEFASAETPAEFFRSALNDSDPQVQHAAVLAAFRKFEKVPDEIIAGAARSHDTYLRQAAVLLMAEKSSVDQLGNMLQSGDAPARLAAALAAGFRLTLPPATGPLLKDLPLVPWRVPEAYTIEFIDGKVNLGELGPIGTYTMAEHWNAGKHTTEQEQLFALLATRLADEDEKVRLQAAHFLYMLNDSRTEPVIARVRTDIERVRLATAPMASVGSLWVAGPFPDGTKGLVARHRPESGPLDPAAIFKAGDRNIGWKEQKPTAGNSLFNFREAFGECDHSSFYAFTRIESGSAQQLLLLAGSDDGIKVWLNGKLLLRSDVVRAALPFQDSLMLDLQPGSNDLLIRVQNVSGECGLYLHYRHLKPVAFLLPEKLGSSTLAERLKEAAANQGESRIDARFLEVKWDEAVKEGDAARGRKLFAADGLGCAKCHAATADAAATGGPSLADAAKRFTIAHLVESVLLPNKTVSPVFKTTLIVTRAGKTYSGLVTGETAERVEMVLTDTNKVTIAAGDIDERKLQDLSPMPAGLVKSPDELRDLLAYLLSTNTHAP
jgi:putative heme-binding domain-containing protein